MQLFACKAVHQGTGLKPYHLLALNDSVVTCSVSHRLARAADGMALDRYALSVAQKESSAPTNAGSATSSWASVVVPVGQWSYIVLQRFWENAVQILSESNCTKSMRMCIRRVLTRACIGGGVLPCRGDLLAADWVLQEAGVAGFNLISSATVQPLQMHALPL